MSLLPMRNSTFGQPIYLDYNATTPISDRSKAVIKRALDICWKNPSSLYAADVKEVVENSRKQLLKLLDCANTSRTQLVFTSGGTEASNWVIRSSVSRARRLGGCHSELGKPHVVTSSIEHDCTAKLLDRLVEMGEIELSKVCPSNGTGRFLAEDVLSAVRPNTCLVTLIYANNETGVIQPIEIVNDLLKQRFSSSSSCSCSDGRLKPVFHTDASQMFGKLAVSVKRLDCVDFVTVTDFSHSIFNESVLELLRPGHKFYAPRIGALYCRDVDRLEPMLFGGGQEFGLRAGTENVPMIAGLGEAAQDAADSLLVYAKHFRKMRDYLESKLIERFGSEAIKVHFADNDHDENSSLRLPNTSLVSFVGRRGAEILERSAVEASCGSACHSVNFGRRPSRVLLASGLSETEALSAVRLSVGRETSCDLIDEAVQRLYEAVCLNEQNGRYV